MHGAERTLFGISITKDDVARRIVQTISVNEPLNITLLHVMKPVRDTNNEPGLPVVGPKKFYLYYYPFFLWFYVN